MSKSKGDPKAKRRTRKPRSPAAVVPITVDPNQRYPIPDSNAILRQSNAKTYLDIKSGKIRVIKDGGRTYIPGSELIRLSTLPTTAEA